MTRSVGVIRNAKATEEKVCMFSVLVVRPFRGRTATEPSSPPTNAMRRASKRKDITMLKAPKPIARMVAISRERSDTAEYIVLSAPKTAPTPMIEATKVPRTVIKVVRPRDCFS